MSETAKFDVRQMLENTHDSLTVRRVFGEPIERGDLVVVPAARVRGGGGGGSGDNGAEQGGGGGFGLTASPAGAFVVRGDDVTWEPAINKERVILASLGLAALAVLAVRTLVRQLIHRL